MRFNTLPHLPPPRCMRILAAQRHKTKPSAPDVPVASISPNEVSFAAIKLEVTDGHSRLKRGTTSPAHPSPPKCLRIGASKIVPGYNWGAESFGAIPEVIRGFPGEIWPSAETAIIGQRGRHTTRRDRGAVPVVSSVEMA